MVTQKDQELLALLKLNGRESVSSLARKLSVSRTSVQDRLHKLEDRGVITGYTVQLGQPVDDKLIKVFVTINVEPGSGPAVAAILKSLPQLSELHAVCGKFDLVAKALCASSAELDKVLDRIGETAGVTATESSVILTTKFSRQ